MVIDLESAEWAQAGALPEDFEAKLRTCTPDALDEQRCFTTLSDMHCIGVLLQSASPPHCPAAQELIGMLLNKQLTAEQALVWLQA